MPNATKAPTLRPEDPEVLESWLRMRSLPARESFPFAARPTSILLTLAAFTVTAGSQPPLTAQIPTAPPTGSYRYSYPNNTAELIEDHYMVFEREDGTLRGWYYGTSDDFDRGREGYLPGFFVAEMEELSVSGGEIRFRLRVDPEAYVTRPVPTSIRSVEELPGDGFRRWTIGPVSTTRWYRGVVEADRIRLLLEGDGERVFERAGGGPTPPATPPSAPARAAPAPTSPAGPPPS